MGDQKTPEQPQGMVYGPLVEGEGDLLEMVRWGEGRLESGPFSHLHE